jgi:hypothetical protein
MVKSSENFGLPPQGLPGEREVRNKRGRRNTRKKDWHERLRGGDK